jgi:hypothetical protein
LKVAGASLVVGSIVPGLASAATAPALAGLAVAVGASWDRLWADSDELPEAARRGAIRLALGIAGIWLVLVLALGGSIAFSVAYYRGTMIVLGLVSLAGFLLAVRGARLGEPKWSLGAVAVVALALKLAHWGYYVPEWNYRNGAGPWGRAIGQWVPEKHPIYVLHAWPADLAFAINRPVRQLASPFHIEYQPGEGSRFVLLQDSEYAEYQHWGQGWPKLIKVAEFEDEEGLGHRILTRTDAPLIVERPYRNVSCRMRTSSRLAARLFLDDPAHAEPPGQLGLNVGPRNVLEPEQHQGVEQEVGDLVDQVLASGLAGLVGGLDDLDRLLGDLRADLRRPPVQERDDVGPLRRRVRLPIGDHGHQGGQDRGFGHGSKPRTRPGSNEANSAEVMRSVGRIPGRRVYSPSIVRTAGFVTLPIALRGSSFTSSRRCGIL